MELNKSNTAPGGGPDNSNSNSFEEEGEGEEPESNPTRAFLGNFTHASVRAAKGADSIDSSFDLLKESYIKSLSPLFCPNYYTKEACLPASRIHQLSELYKALAETIEIPGNLPNCETGSFMRFSDNVTNTTIKNTKGNLKEDTEIDNIPYLQRLELKPEDVVKQEEWELKCLNYTSRAEPENSNELFQIYNDAYEIYINSSKTVQDLRKFHKATERADDDKMGGVFVFLLMYCEGFPNLPKIITPHSLFNLLELDNCWKRTKLIWGLLPKTMSAEDYSPDEDPDIIKLMTTIDKIIRIWNEGCKSYERIEINKKGDKIEQEEEVLDEAGNTIDKFNEIGTFITQSNSVILHTLTHVLERFVFQLLPQPELSTQPAYNDFFTGNTYEELVLYIQTDTINTKTYEHFTACRVVILPRTLANIDVRKSLLQRIKEIQQTPSQTAFADEEEIQLSSRVEKLTSQLDREINTAIANSKSCSLRPTILGKREPGSEPEADPEKSSKGKKTATIGGKKRFTRKNTKKFTKKSHKKIKTTTRVSKHSHRKRETKKRR